jgi:DeoR family fructose operon transcriptional repressor
MEHDMFVEERRSKIIELLNKKNRASVPELSHLLRVTTATIRRDLSHLEQRALIIRTHGGALKIDKTSGEASLQERVTLHKDEKQRIAQFVAQLVLDGETIMMDGGSTTLIVAQKLNTKRDLTIITNSPPIAAVIAEQNGCKVILTGGEVRKNTDTLVGTITESTIKQFRADKTIIGMSGLLSDEGFFTVSPPETEIKRIMARCGKETIVVMDSSKVGKVTLSFVFDFSSVDKLITDTNISKEDADLIRKHEIEVITV